MIDEIFKLLVGEGVAEFTERIRQSPVVPLVILGVLGMVSLSEATSEAMRSPNSSRICSTVVSVSSTVSCSAAAASNSWTFVIVATISTASIGWTI